MDRKNFLRRQFGQEARAAIFMKDYFEIKHQEIYAEAVAFYNHVNNLHPEKKDIRKTEEFKALKRGFTFVAKKQDKAAKNPPQQYLPITTVNHANFTVITNDDLQIAEQTTVDQTTAVQTTVDQTTAVQTTVDQTTAVQTTVDQTTAEQTTVDQTTAKPQKIMQLRIPLLPSCVITETTNIVAQEIIDENPLTKACEQLPDIYPTLDQEIPEEAFNAILAGLHQDPDLSKLMDDIQEEFNQEIVQDPALNCVVEDMERMDIDLPIEDDRLEQYLQDWEAW